MKVREIHVNSHGSGIIILVDRYGKQVTLSFDDAFDELTLFINQELSLTPVALYYQHRLVATRMNDGIRISDKIRWLIHSVEGLCVG